MLRFLLLTLRIVLPSLTLLSAAAITLSGTQPPNPALAGFSRCDYGGWCWFGIRPGVTTVREADQLLRDAGYERVKWRNYFAPDDSGLCDIGISPQEDFEIVWYMGLDCSDYEIRVGDLAGVLGNPTAVGIYEPDPSYDLGVYLVPTFIFENLLLRTRYSSESLFDSSPYFYIIPLNEGFRVTEWGNFNYYDYCRIEPSAYGCP